MLASISQARDVSVESASQQALQRAASHASFAARQVRAPQVASGFVVCIASLAFMHGGFSAVVVDQSAFLCAVPFPAGYYIAAEASHGCGAHTHAQAVARSAVALVRWVVLNSATHWRFAGSWACPTMKGLGGGGAVHS
jgi:hypothetical protein